MGLGTVIGLKTPAEKNADKARMNDFVNSKITNLYSEKHYFEWSQADIDVTMFDIWKSYGYQTSWKEWQFQDAKKRLDKERQENIARIEREKDDEMHWNNLKEGQAEDIRELVKITKEMAETNKELAKNIQLLLEENQRLSKSSSCMQKSQPLDKNDDCELDLG